MHVTAIALTDFLNTVAGLPTHPLVVHIAVVMLPLASISLIIIILVPRWRAAYGWLTMGGLAVGTIGAVLSAQTGEALARTVGLPEDHARWGDLLEKLGVALLVIAAIWFFVQRRTAARTPGITPALLGPPLQAILAVLSVGVAIAALALTVVVGHSGATAVWEGRVVEAGPVSAVPAPEATPTPEVSPTPGASASPSTAPASPSAAPASPSPAAASPSAATLPAFTMADVASHAAVDSCWAVVDGSVYDLTTWIDRHPGGKKAIKALCGTDGSASFHKEHDSQQEPSDALAEFRIGTLTP
ncbi:cytochrome b5-like heme/steroid binding domain-containing protein [Tessaracoccus antarcticus]|nr:cytochrome b5-like heme/steroid binding domain-containing protein [Tessaracoccus antarcticus]